MMVPYLSNKELIFSTSENSNVIVSCIQTSDVKRPGCKSAIQNFHHKGEDLQN